MNYLLPNDQSVHSLLGALFDEGTKVSAAPKQDQPTDWVALYVGDDDTPVAACVCSKEFVAYASSALTMLPAAVAKQAAGDGKFTEVMVGSFHEIMNICSRLLLNDTTPHLRLSKVCRRQEAPALAELAKTASRKDFQVQIPRYGAGRMTCMVT